MAEKGEKPVIDARLRCLVEEAVVREVEVSDRAIMTKSVALRIWYNGTSALMQAVLIMRGHRPDPTFDEMADRFCKQNGLLGRWNLDCTELIFVLAPEGQEGYFDPGY